MPEYLAPGVFVEEVSSGVKPIQGASTSTIGMVGVTERGPVGRPILVTNFGDFLRAFGGFLDHREYPGERHVLPHAAQGAFDNGAGRIYVVRVLGKEAKRATVDLLGPFPGDAAQSFLLGRTAKGAKEIWITEGSGVKPGDRLLLRDGPRSEYATAASDPEVKGLALARKLRASFGAETEVQRLAAAPDPGDNQAFTPTEDLKAGGPLALDDESKARLKAGDVLQLSEAENPATTEFVTIAADGAPEIEEGGLLFDHAKDAVKIEKVLTEPDGPPVKLTASAAAGGDLLALDSMEGFEPGDLLEIGGELHQARELAAQLPLQLASAIAETHAKGVAVIRQTPLLRVHARDPGGWGDRLRLRVKPASLCETRLTEPAEIGDRLLKLASSVGLHPGSVLTILRGPEKRVVARQAVACVAGRNEVELAEDLEAALQAGDVAASQELSLTIELLNAQHKVQTSEVFDGLALAPEHPRYAPKILGGFDRARDRGETAGLSDLIRLSDLTRGDDGADEPDAAARRLSAPEAGIDRRLSGGDDHISGITEAAYVGEDATDAADRTGLHALTTVEDVSIVAAPGQSGLRVQTALIDHCELMRYRIAVLDSAPAARLADVQEQRQLHDSTRAALYHPWLEIADPFGRPNDRIGVPPSGHVCGAFALTDATRGVHKAPANMVVRGALGLRALVTTGEQEILNPRGINVIRDFSSQGRAKRIWGARTISSDSEWTYVPVRRLFLFLEKSIENSMSFAIFEPNDQALWAKVRRSLDGFLTSVWRSGALVGQTPEEAFHIEVGPSTMTPADIDQGRLIVEVAVAPSKPAEFVIFRISQKTAGAAD